MCICITDHSIQPDQLSTISSTRTLDIGNLYTSKAVKQRWQAGKRHCRPHSCGGTLTAWALRLWKQHLTKRHHCVCTAVSLVHWSINWDIISCFANRTWRLYVTPITYRRLPSKRSPPPTPSTYPLPPHLIGRGVRLLESGRPWVRFPLAPGFSGSSHISDLKIGTTAATLRCAWRYKVSTGTGWPCVRILTGWDRKFDLQLLSQCGSTCIPLSEQIRHWDTQACCWDIKQPTN